MYRSALPDERFCLDCLKNLDEQTNFTRMFLGDDLLCQDCRAQWIEHKRVYLVDGIKYYVLYEYNEHLEGLFFRYKEQKDIALAPIFLNLYKTQLHAAMKKYNVCGMCSSDQKYLQRGFIPIEEIFSSIDIPLSFPLFKVKDHKQSNQSRITRNLVNEIIQRKKLYPMRHKKILLVDDVCTTGFSLKRAVYLLRPELVFVISAHPLWVKENKQNELVEKKHIFW